MNFVLCKEVIHIKKWKYVIVSPRQGSGGAIVEHLLCKMLMEKGYDAKIFYFESDFTGKNISPIKTWMKYLSYIRHDTNKLLKCRLFPNANFLRGHRYKGYNYEPVRWCRRKYLPFVDDNTIVVYSEGIYGNPLNAKNVVRWFLYKNRYPGDYKAYGDNDLFFSYREHFNDEKINPTCRLCRLRNFDYELYRDYGYKRSGKCYILRKGKSRSDLPAEFDGPIIDSLSEQELVEVLNRVEYCISYDTLTFYSTIAAVCGCKSIIMPEQGKSRKDYTEGDEKNYGVSYGMGEDEIKYAQETHSDMMRVINSFKVENNRAVDYFVKECMEFFNCYDTDEK